MILFIHMKECLVCKLELSGRQVKFCSVQCKLKEPIYKAQHYSFQRERGIKRKLEIFNSRGGACEVCGYNKNIAAIEFHHRVPSEKKFGIDLRSLGNGSMSKMIDETNKCDMICSNCHKEKHHPDFLLENILREQNNTC